MFTFLLTQFDKDWFHEKRMIFLDNGGDQGTESRDEDAPDGGEPPLEEAPTPPTLEATSEAYKQATTGIDQFIATLETAIVTDKSLQKVGVKSELDDDAAKAAKHVLEVTRGRLSEIQAEQTIRLQEAAAEASGNIDQIATELRAEIGTILDAAAAAGTSKLETAKGGEGGLEKQAASVMEAAKDQETKIDEQIDRLALPDAESTSPEAIVILTQIKALAKALTNKKQLDPTQALIDAYQTILTQNTNMDPAVFTAVHQAMGGFVTELGGKEATGRLPAEADARALLQAPVQEPKGGEVAINPDAAPPEQVVQQPTSFGSISLPEGKTVFQDGDHVLTAALTKLDCADGTPDQNIRAFQELYGLRVLKNGSFVIDGVAGEKTTQMINIQLELQALEAQFKDQEITVEGLLLEGGILKDDNPDLKTAFNTLDESNGENADQNIRSFQEKYGLAVDGIAGPKTIGLINDLLTLKTLRAEASKPADKKNGPEDATDDSASDTVKESYTKPQGAPDVLITDPNVTALLTANGFPGGQIQFQSAPELNNPNKIRLTSETADALHGARWCKTKAGAKREDGGQDAYDFLVDQDVSNFHSIEINIVDSDTIQIIRRRKENGPGIKTYITFPHSIELTEPDLKISAEQKAAEAKLNELEQALVDDAPANDDLATVVALEDALLTENGDYNPALAQALGLDEGILVPQGAETPTHLITVDNIGNIIITTLDDANWDEFVAGVDSSSFEAVPKSTTEGADATEDSSEKVRQNIENIQNVQELVTYFETNFPGIVINKETAFMGVATPETLSKYGFKNLNANQNGAIIHFDYVLNGKVETINYLSVHEKSSKAMDNALTNVLTQVESTHVDLVRSSYNDPEGAYQQEIQTWKKNPETSLPGEVELKLALKENSDAVHGIEAFDTTTTTDGNRKTVRVNITLKLANNSTVDLQAEASGGNKAAPDELLGKALKDLAKQISKVKSEPISGDLKTEALTTLAAHKESADKQNFNLDGQLKEKEAQLTTLIEGMESTAAAVLKAESREQIRSNLNLKSGSCHFEFYRMEAGSVKAYDIRLTNGLLTIYPTPTGFDGKQISVGISDSTAGGSMTGRFQEATGFAIQESDKNNFIQGTQITLSPETVYRMVEALVDGNLPAEGGKPPAAGRITASSATYEDPAHIFFKLEDKKSTGSTTASRET